MLDNNTQDTFTTVTLRGAALGLLYLSATQADDTNLRNIILFTVFYLSMFYGANYLGFDVKIITTAFITKTVFTLIDDRLNTSKQVIKKEKERDINNLI
jgi:hypothetical protein